jgi:hypothetical protein
MVAASISREKVISGSVEVTWVAILDLKSMCQWVRLVV